MIFVRYAAYGSNLHPRRLKARTPSAQLVGIGFLPDWSLRFHKRSVDTSGKCNILYGSSGLYVAVYRMNATDKQELDRIEGLGSGYVDGSINVPEFGVCATYFAADSHIDEALLPFDWYREMVLLGCRALELPAEYVQKIEQITVMRDSDSQRRQDNWNIVQMLRESRARRAN